MAIAEIEVRRRLKLETVVGRVEILQTLVHTNQLPTIIMIRPRNCLMFHFGGISETAASHEGEAVMKGKGSPTEAS